MRRLLHGDRGALASVFLKSACHSLEYNSEPWSLCWELLLLYTCVFLLRLSKKPGDNKTKKSKQVSQKYTAARLHEKGVLISIEDLQPNQWVVQLIMYTVSFMNSPRLEVCRSSALNSRLLLFSHRRFKNAIFEISPSETVGVFDVKAKFMGVHLETLQLEYQVALPFSASLALLAVAWPATYFGWALWVFVSQDLLQLQYEGVAVMKLFDRATINVNLLIFLLNKKFYGK